MEGMTRPIQINCQNALILSSPARYGDGLCPEKKCVAASANVTEGIRLTTNVFKKYGAMN